MKTKITMSNGDRHILSGHPEDFMKKWQNSTGKITIETQAGPRSIKAYDIVTFQRVIN